MNKFDIQFNDYWRTLVHFVIIGGVGTNKNPLVHIENKNQSKDTPISIEIPHYCLSMY